jgi:hypothetical protein
MKIIVTHISPDWDAIGGVWVLKKFLPGWQEAAVEFVPAGGRRTGKGKFQMAKPGLNTDAIELQGKDEVIHVDTGLGPLDHHETSDYTVSGTSRAWEYVLSEIEKSGNTMKDTHKNAVSRVVKFIVDTDHFKEVFWPEASADRYEFSILGVLEGLKLLKPDEHDYYVSFGQVVLDSLFHTFENRIQAEEEINGKGIIFETKRGKGIGFDTGNDSVLKLAQKMGYHLVVRKDPKGGFVRIKVRPPENKTTDIDLTLAYERFSRMDPDATWFLHVSKKMLLNGGSKNPHQVPTNLSLQRIIDVLKELY